MDVDSYFDSLGRRSGETAAQRRQSPLGREGSTATAAGSNAESFYSVHSVSGGAPSASVMKEKSLGRVWKPRQSSTSSFVTRQQTQQLQSSTTGTSDAATSPPPTTPPPVVFDNTSDQQQTQQLQSSTTGTSDAATSPPPTTPPPVASDNTSDQQQSGPPTIAAGASASTRSLSYLPPGAASPSQYKGPTYVSGTGNSMAGVGSGNWTGTVTGARRGSSSTSPPDPSTRRNTEQPAALIMSGEQLVESPPPQEPHLQTARLPAAVKLGSASPPPPKGGNANPDYGITVNGNPSNAQQRTSSPPAASSSHTIPLNQASPYPVFPAPASQLLSLALPVEARRGSQPQTRTAPRAKPVEVIEEICVECMMRDRDMADVDVTGGGVWERESDVWYNELCRREEEEDMRARLEGVPPPSRSPQNGGRQRPKAKGGRLTEENLKVWLTMNPKEPQARWQTLEAYIKSQHQLLVAEAAARAQAQRESRLIDNRLRESYSQIRRSGYEITPSPHLSPSGSAVNGIQVRVAASPSIPTSIGSGEKDVTLLENGLIVERVDIRKEEREEKARVRSQERHRRRMSSAGVNDASSVYGASLYSAPSPTLDNGLTAFLPNGSHVGPLQQSPTSNRFSTASGQPLNLARPPVQRGTSQASIETTGTGVRRFFGYKHWGGASQSSLAISGSMMDMHLGLDQDRRAYVSQDIPYDLSAPPSLEFGNEGQPFHSEKRMAPEPHRMSDDRSSTQKSKKKSSGFGKLWKLVTGQGHRSSEPQMREKGRIPAPEDDLSAPLAPPPPLSYLVGGRSDRSPHSRHLSSPSLSGPSSGPHPRSISAPGPAQSATAVSPPTAPSSLLPSPTSNRFPWRDSGDEPRNSGGTKDDIDHDIDGTEDQARRISTMDSRTMQGPRFGAVSPIPPSTSRGFLQEKALPSLPAESAGLAPPPAGRAMTVNMNQSGELAVPNAPFRMDMRRQSFNGVTNKFSRQTWIAPNDMGFAPPPSVGARYDEFGGSRRSLGKFEDVRGRSDSPSFAKREKTRSRFALSSLFSNKKHQSSLPTIYLGSATSSTTLAPFRGNDVHTVHHARDYSASHSSFSEMGAYNPRSLSNGSHNPRTSVASSKKIALIVQDEDFFAYRYPSHSQTLPLQR